MSDSTHVMVILPKAFASNYYQPQLTLVQFHLQSRHSQSVNDRCYVWSRSDNQYGTVRLVPIPITIATIRSSEVVVAKTCSYKAGEGGGG